MPLVTEEERREMYVEILQRPHRPPVAVLELLRLPEAVMTPERLTGDEFLYGDSFTVFCRKGSQENVTMNEATTVAGLAARLQSQPSLACGPRNGSAVTA